MNDDDHSAHWPWWVIIIAVVVAILVINDMSGPPSNPGGDPADCVHHGNQLGCW